MLKVAVLVSGGGTNLQAIIDGIENGSITNAKIDVVISNNKNALSVRRNMISKQLHFLPKILRQEIYLTKHCITSL